jgi:Putative Zn-dependent protease, contains TPR repeats
VLSAQSTAKFEDLVARASMAKQQSDLPLAIELYRQALQVNSSWPDGWWSLGSLQYAQNDYASAEDSITHYLQLTPNAAPAFALRGLCEFETGKYAQSIRDIDEGLSLGAGNQPKNDQILRYHEALALTRTGQFETALATYAFFARNEITNPELITGIGMAGLRIPLLPNDLQSGQQDLVSAAGNAAYSLMAGNKDAKRTFQDLFQHFPDAINAHYLYGYLLFSTDQETAITEFKQELALDPSNAAANIMMAWASILQNRFSEGLPYAEKAEAEEPDLPIAQLMLGRLLVETGDKEGLKYLEKARQQEPSNLDVHLALVKAYAESGRSEDARRERLLCLQLTKTEALYGAPQN